MNYMGARFSADAAAMEPFMAELGKRGLVYLDDGSSARSVAPELALKDGVPFAAGDTAIDAEQDRGAILKKLDQLEATARAKGFADRHRLGLRRDRRCRHVLGRTRPRSAASRSCRSRPWPSIRKKG